MGIPLEAITASGNNIFHWEGVAGDVFISISARKLPEDRFYYIAAVDLCGFPEKWWPSNRLRLAEASGEKVEFLEIEIRRQLKRLHVKL